MSQISRQDDGTVQKLYKIAHRIFGKEAASEEVETCAIDNITTQAITHMQTAKTMLIDDVLDEAARKRTVDCLDRGMEEIEELRARSKIPKTTAPPAQHNTALATALDTSNASDINTNAEWDFIDNYRKEKGTSMKWKECYQAGTNQGMFKSYEKWQTLKAAYFRHCRISNQK